MSTEKKYIPLVNPTCETCPDEIVAPEELQISEDPTAPTAVKAHIEKVGDKRRLVINP